MSRGWIIGIVCLAISASSSPNSWAQEVRPGKTEGLSFTERLTALRENFRREKPSEEFQQNAPIGNQRKNESPQPTTTSKSASTSARADRSVPGTRYRRKKSRPIPQQADPQQQTGENAPRVASKRRAGSVSSNKSKSRPSRYPSISESTKKLGVALSDILSSEDSRKTRTVQVAVAEETSPTTSPKTKRKSSRRPKTAKRATFDVHEALVGSEKESRSDSKPKTEKDIEEKNIEEKNLAKKNLAQEQESTPVVQQPDVNERAKPQPTARKSRPKTVQQAPVTRYGNSEQPIAEKNELDPFEATNQESTSANSMRNSSRENSFATSRQAAPVQQHHQPSIQPQGELLLSSQQPVIVSQVKGPRRISVGQEATYQITLENTSDRKAETIAAAVRIPEWAEIIDVTSTNGAVERNGEGNNGDVLEWQLQELPARSSATLRLRLIPRSGRPMQLGIQWSQAAVSSETMVEVQEPKLEVGLSGPQEVLFGQPQRYRLILRNPGTGVAEQVVVQLIPPGGDQQSATTQTIGPLQAGEVKEIELELTAREAGELIMQASAVAEGGLSAQAVKKVLCRRPELQIDWRGPDTKYAGTISAYYIRVQNPGTAMTEPVTVTFELPEGSLFVSASDGHTLDKANRTISWRLAGLGVDEAQFMQVRCEMDQPGVNRFSVTAQSDNEELSDTKTIETNIVALADLKLEVTDPQGPLPLGDSALYEIRVSNRGRTAAKGINITGLFSAGIDPVSVEGAQYTERDGRVIFHPIKSLPAGREIVLRIRAKATQEGTHIFRAEVNCEDLEIKLAAEETTRFFKDASRWEDGQWEDSQTPYSAENDETVSR